MNEYESDEFTGIKKLEAFERELKKLGYETKGLVFEKVSSVFDDFYFWTMGVRIGEPEIAARKVAEKLERLKVSDGFPSFAR